LVVVSGKNVTGGVKFVTSSSEKWAATEGKDGATGFHQRVKWLAKGGKTPRGKKKTWKIRKRGSFRTE